MAGIIKTIIEGILEGLDQMANDLAGPPQPRRVPTRVPPNSGPFPGTLQIKLVRRCPPSLLLNHRLTVHRNRSKPHRIVRQSISMNMPHRLSKPLSCQLHLTSWTCHDCSESTQIPRWSTYSDNRQRDSQPA